MYIDDKQSGCHPTNDDWILFVTGRTITEFRNVTSFASLLLFIEDQLLKAHNTSFTS